jgi:hypothetical protein
MVLFGKSVCDGDDQPGADDPAYAVKLAEHEPEQHLRVEEQLDLQGPVGTVQMFAAEDLLDHREVERYLFPRQALRRHADRVDHGGTEQDGGPVAGNARVAKRRNRVHARALEGHGEAADQEKQVDAIVAEPERERRRADMPDLVAIVRGVMERDDGQCGQSSQGIEFDDARSARRKGLQTGNSVRLAEAKCADHTPVQAGNAQQAHADGLYRYNRRFRQSVRRMRILVVTSQFPIAGEPTRGRPIHQTLTELGRLATVRVLSPVARYPRWARPRSYLFRAPDAGQSASGCDAVHVTYPALPMLSRPFNGWLCGRALRAEARAFAPDVILSYWLYRCRGAVRLRPRCGRRSQRSCAAPDRTVVAR